MASPICQVKEGAGAYGPTTNGVNATAGATMTINLVSQAGVSSWAISCIGTDENQVATTTTAALTIDGVQKTAVYTQPAAGTALIFQSSVTDTNGVTTSTTFGVYTLTADGLRVGAVGEELEGSTAYGWVTKLNAAIRRVATRTTALDANHLHAWELEDASGNFVDTGSSASKVNLTATGVVIYGTPGLVGSCPVFGVSSTGAFVDTIYGRALSSAFSDLPTGSCSIECWFRSYSASLGYLIGTDNVGSTIMNISGSSTPEALSHTVNATSFKNASVAALNAPAAPYVWHHIASVYDSATGDCFLYLDGEVVIKQTGQTGNVAWTTGTTPSFSIGLGQNAAGGFHGQMSRVRLSNTARSQSYCRTVYETAMQY